jgi:hypothetical protein
MLYQSIRNTFGNQLKSMGLDTYIGMIEMGTKKRQVDGS